MENIEFEDIRDFYKKEVDQETFELALKDVHDFFIGKNYYESDNLLKEVKFDKTKFTKYLSDINMFISEKIFSSFDISKKGYLSYEDFCNPIRVLKFGSFEDVVKIVFNIYDFNSDGKVNTSDIKQLLSYLPLKPKKDKKGYSYQMESLAELDDIMNCTFGEEKKGITYDNFLELLKRRADVFLLLVCYLFMTIPIFEKSMALYKVVNKRKKSCSSEQSQSHSSPDKKSSSNETPDPDRKKNVIINGETTKIYFSPLVKGIKLQMVPTIFSSVEDLWKRKIQNKNYPKSALLCAKSFRKKEEFLNMSNMDEIDNQRLIKTTPLVKRTYTQKIEKLAKAEVISRINQKRDSLKDDLDESDVQIIEAYDDKTKNQSYKSIFDKFEQVINEKNQINNEIKAKPIDESVDIFKEIKNSIISPMKQSILKQSFITPNSRSKSNLAENPEKIARKITTGVAETTPEDKNKFLFKSSPRLIDNNSAHNSPFHHDSPPVKTKKSCFIKRQKLNFNIDTYMEGQLQNKAVKSALIPKKKFSVKNANMSKLKGFSKNIINDEDKKAFTVTPRKKNSVANVTLSQLSGLVKNMHINEFLEDKLDKHENFRSPQKDKSTRELNLELKKSEESPTKKFFFNDKNVIPEEKKEVSDQQYDSVDETTKISNNNDITETTSENITETIEEYLTTEEEVKKNTVFEGEVNTFSEVMHEIELNKVYLVIIDKTLYYYKNQQSSIEKENYISSNVLEGSFVRLNSPEYYENKTFNSFSVFLQNGNTIKFYHKDIDMIKLWVKHLRESINYRNLFDYYNILSTIGEGQYGKVTMGIKNSNKQKVAVKIISKKKIKENHVWDMIRAEIDILKISKHPNIVSYIDNFENSDYIFIIMDYINSGTLQDFIKRRNNNLSEKLVAKVAYQLADAIKYLHKFGIIHRDLKPDNIMVIDDNCEDSNIQVKITDFGFGKIIGHSEKAKEGYGTLGFVAPEVLLRIPYNHKVDIWSLGVIIFYMFHGDIPFKGKSKDETSKMICNKELIFPIKFKQLSMELLELIYACLTKSPEKRISLEKILNNRWFAKLKII